MFYNILIWCSRNMSIIVNDNSIHMETLDNFLSYFY